MKGKPQKFLVLLIGLPLFLYAVFEARNFWFYFQNQREAVHYVLPNDYLGWVVITYDQACPTSELVSGVRRYVIPQNGLLCVQDAAGDGFAQDQVYHENRPEQNLLQHPSSLANYVWYEKRFTVRNKTHFVFYVGHEVPKKDQPKLFEELHRLLAINSKS